MVNGGARLLAAALAAGATAGCSALLDFDSPMDAGGAPVADAALPACAFLEPNDSIASALPIVEGTLSAALCADDRDFYHFDLGQFDSVVLELRFANPEQRAALDLALYEVASGERVSVSRGTSDIERIEHLLSSDTELPAGSYAAEVFADSGYESAYELELDITPPLSPQ